MIVNGKRLYKVVGEQGESLHGGSLTWSLPDGETPGEWHEVEHVVMCRSGLHLTASPIAWWKPKCRVFEVEAEGLYEEGGQAYRSDKVVAKRARLVRELGIDELASLRIIREGIHTFTDGRVVVEGSASVTAYGSAKVEASDSASVRASDSASVTAYGSAKVEASGSVLILTRPGLYTPNKAVITLAESASHVDYRDGAPKFRTAEAP